jgi:hypothetical protein
MASALEAALAAAAETVATEQGASIPEPTTSSASANESKGESGR